MNEPKFGATLFSFTPEYLLGGLDRRQILELLAGLEGTQHVEFVGPQHLRSFPARLRRRAQRSAALSSTRSSSCHRAYADSSTSPPIRSGRSTSPRSSRNSPSRSSPRSRQGSTCFASSTPAAGARAARRRCRTTRGDRWRWRSTRRYDHPCPAVQEALELFDRVQSPHLGFLADFGATARHLSRWLADVYRAKQVPESAIAMSGSTGPAPPTRPDAAPRGAGRRPTRSGS